MGVWQCPLCRTQPPFTVDDAGLLVTVTTWRRASKRTPTPRMIRRPWELVAMDHIRSNHRLRWAELVAQMATRSTP